MGESENLLVLGANGFLGKNVVDLLEEKYNYKIYKLHGQDNVE